MTIPLASTPTAAPPIQPGSDPCLDAARVALRAAGAREVCGHRVISPGVHTYRGLTATGSARVVVVEADDGPRATLVGRAQARRLSVALRLVRTAQSEPRQSPKRLSPGQVEVLNLLIEGLRTRHRTMTIREIMESRGTTGTNAVAEVIEALEKKGYVQRFPNAPGLRILRWPDGAVFRLDLVRGGAPT